MEMYLLRSTIAHTPWSNQHNICQRPKLVGLLTQHNNYGTIFKRQYNILFRTGVHNVSAGAESVRHLSTTKGLSNMKCIEAIFSFDDGSTVIWTPTAKSGYGPEMHDVKFHMGKRFTNHSFEGATMVDGTPSLEQSFKLREDFVGMVNKFEK